MKQISYFDQNPKATNAWLHRLNLKVGELVSVNGQVYRFGLEREGRDAVLAPVEPR